MLRGVGYKTMRVPKTFDIEIMRMKKKYGYKNSTDFIHYEIVPLMKNSEQLSDIFRLSRKNGKKN